MVDTLYLCRVHEKWPSRVVYWPMMVECRTPCRCRYKQIQHIDACESHTTQQNNFHFKCFSRFDGVSTKSGQSMSAHTSHRPHTQLNSIHRTMAWMSASALFDIRLFYVYVCGSQTAPTINFIIVIFAWRICAATRYKYSFLNNCQR